MADMRQGESMTPETLITERYWVGKTDGIKLQEISAVIESHLDHLEIETDFNHFNVNECDISVKVSGRIVLFIRWNADDRTVIQLFDETVINADMIEAMAKELRESCRKL